MNWVNDFLKKKADGEDISKEAIMAELRDVSHKLLAKGYDWKDVELFCVAGLGSTVGNYIILVLKWLKEIKDEESEGVTN